MQDVRSLELRVAQLESANRSLGRSLKLTVVAGAAAVVAGFSLSGRAVTAQGTPEIVKARCFAAVDEDGNVRGVFSGEKGKVGFVLVDKKGNTRIGLVEKKDLSALICNDQEGKPKVVLGVNEGTGVIEVDDKEGNAMLKKPE